MTSVLLIENFLVWVVSATYPPGQVGPPYPDPLQDNGRAVTVRVMNFMGLTMDDAQLLRDGVGVQWALVTAAIGGSLLSCELGLGKASGRSMWAVAMRGMLTLGIARAIRAVSFVLTVLPSQTMGCYRNKYPFPPPSDWVSWIAVGIRPAARGGCNDLIVSGHATVTSALACVCTSVADNPYFSGAVWSLLAFDYGIEILQGFHYSVDMWLGAVLTALIFRGLRGVEENWDEDELRGDLVPVRRSATVGIWTSYGLPALLGFGVLTFTREAVANVWLVLYVLTAIYLQVRGRQHLSRHLLICLVYITLGVYL